MTATLRYDGSSKFGANNKWGLFPSIAGGWTISDEDFFPQSDAFNYLKLRVSWGQTGNSEGVGPYQSLQLYGQSGTYYDGGINNFLPGYAITQNTNPNLKWEVVTQANLGLDFQLGNGRFSGSIDLFDKTTSDMLYRLLGSRRRCALLHELDLRQRWRDEQQGNRAFIGWRHCSAVILFGTAG